MKKETIYMHLDVIESEGLMVGDEIFWRGKKCIVGLDESSRLVAIDKAIFKQIF